MIDTEHPNTDNGLAAVAGRAHIAMHNEPPASSGSRPEATAPPLVSLRSSEAPATAAGRLPELAGVTRKVLGVLQHTSQTGRYVTGEASVAEMARNGLLNDHGGTGFWPAGTRGYTMTVAGRELLNLHERHCCRFPQPKRKRSASEQFVGWRAYCEAFGKIPFGRFVKDVWPFRSRYA